MIQRGLCNLIETFQCEINALNLFGWELNHCFHFSESHSEPFRADGCEKYLRCPEYLVTFHGTNARSG